MADSGKFGDDIQRYAGNLKGDWFSPVDHDLLTKCNSWLVEGIRDLVKRATNVDASLAIKFSVDKSDYTATTTGDATGRYYTPYDSDSYGDVLQIYLKDTTTKKKYMANQVSRLGEAYLGDTNSIYYATKESPSWFPAGLSVHVYPNDVGTTAGFIQVYYDTSVTTASDAIANFPADYYIFPVLFTAKQVLKYKLSAMRDRLPDVPNYDGYALPVATASADASSTGVNETVTQASTVDGYSQTNSQATDYNEGWNAVRWYIENEEDLEIASAKMNELNAEQQVFATDYQWLQNQLTLVNEEYEQRFVASFGIMTGGQE